MIEEDPRCDAETAVDGVIGEDEGVGSIGHGCDACARGFNTVGWQRLSDRDIAREVVIDRPADNKIAGIERGLALRQAEGWQEHRGKCDGNGNT